MQFRLLRSLKRFGLEKFKLRFVHRNLQKKQNADSTGEEDLLKIFFSQFAWLYLKNIRLDSDYDSVVRSVSGDDELQFKFLAAEKNNVGLSSRRSLLIL